MNRPQYPAAVLAQQRRKAAERPLAADVTDDFVQLVLRQAGLLCGGENRVAGLRMRLAERSHRLLDLLWSEADFRREVLHRGVVRNLVEDAVE